MAMSRPLTGREAAKALRSLTDHAADAAREVINETTEAVKKEAQRRAPVRTGRLQLSVDSRKAGGRRLLGAVGVKVTRGSARRGEIFEGEKQDAYYWKFVEYGTSKMGARPMFRPAAESQKNQHELRMRALLAKAADEMVRNA